MRRSESGGYKAFGWSWELSLSRIKITVPPGAMGDILSALLEAGLPHSDAAELAEFITLNGETVISTHRFKRASLDADRLVSALRSAGLQVKWSAEPSAES
jgi:hypothetical protein